MSNDAPWPVRMADSVMQRASILGKKWAYEWGVVLRGIESVWQQTGDQRREQKQSQGAERKG